MKKPRLNLAVIIPTLNEEKYIGVLLNSIYSQSVCPQEIVVVDALSEDKTKPVVKSFLKKLPQLKFYQIKKDTISRQRNLGAKVTKSPHLLFLDADMELKDNLLLEKYYQEVLEKKPDIAAATNLPNSTFWKDRLFFKGMDLTFKALKPIWPMANGMNLYIKRDIFKKVGGYDEKIKVGEDHELVQRVIKNGGQFLFLKTPKTHTSVRRLQKVGRRKFFILLIFSLFMVLLVGYRKNPVSSQYELGKHH